MEEESKNNFGTQGSDIAALLARGTLGAMPFAGSILAEIVGSIIPGQRIDRIAAYLNKLHSIFSEKDFQRIKELPQKIALLEEGMLAAALTPQVSRLERIAYAIAHGLSKEEFNADHQSTILRVVRELSDAEAIILEFYGRNDGKPFSIAIATEFEDRYPEIWPKYQRTKNDLSSEEERQQLTEYSKLYHTKKAYLTSYKQNLASLALLERVYDASSFPPQAYNRTKDDSVDIQELKKTVTALTKGSAYKITLMGLEVLAAIKQPEVAL